MSLAAERAALRDDLLGFIAAPDPDAFDALARRVVGWQAKAVAPYGRLVAATGGPQRGWRDAPLVPTELFRDLELVASDVGPPVAIYQTSGTTGAGRRGRRLVPDLTLYDAAMEAPFVAHVLAGDATPRPWVSLIPPAERLPDSSLSHMVSALAGRLASRVTWTEALPRPEGEPVVVLATAFALVQALDAAPERRVRLAPGSRLMLTGGFKGRTRELDEVELLALVQERLGLAPDDVVPEYGMTELTSQAYGRPLVAPPWLRLRVVDAETQADVAAGERGLVAFFDLLNLDNVSAIVTGDLGSLDPAGGLTLHGRAPGAVLRGCSLSAEELAGGR